MRRSAHDISRQSVALAALVALAACAAPVPQRDAALQPGLDRAPGVPSRAIEERRRERERRMARHLRARAHIDSLGAGCDCGALPEVEGTAERAWARAWCALRTEDWALLARSSRRALPVYESRAAFRRQIELHLMEALAAEGLESSGASRVVALANAPSSTDALARATELFRASRMAWYARLDDPFGGDLPYLAAMAQARGLPIELRPPGGAATPSARRLLSIAAHEYGTVASAGASRPYVERARAKEALERGAPAEAAGALLRALELDRAGGSSRAGLLADLEVAARLAARLGADDVAATLGVWLYRSIGRHPLAVRAAETLPTSTSSLRRALGVGARRRALAQAIRDLRADPQQALAPPHDFIVAAADLDPASVEMPGASGVYYQIASLLDEQGRRVAARRWLERAVEQIEALRARIPDPQLRRRYFSDKRPVYTALVDLGVGVDTPNRGQRSYLEALQTANALKARGLLDLLDGDRGFAAPRRDPPLSGDPARVEIGDQAGRVAELLGRWFPGAQGRSAAGRTVGSKPRPVLEVDSVRGIVASLPADVAVVEYLLGRRRSYVWIITHEGMQMRRLAGQDVLLPLLEKFQRSLVDTHFDDDEWERHRRLAQRLYVELVGPFEDLVVDHDHLVIAPDQHLHNLAFEALARPTRGARLDYLVHHFSMTYTPSSAVRTRLMGRRSTRGRGQDGEGSKDEDTSQPEASEALVIGAPRLEQQALHLLEIGRSVPDGGQFALSRIFPKMPGSRSELELVARELTGRGVRPEVLGGGAASEAALRTRDLRRYRYLHIATHGISDAPPWLARARSRDLHFEQPALLLAEAPEEPDDGVVTLAEVLRWRTRAELAVLSGCTTGRGWLALGDGAYGLAGALLYTGSRAVIASAWSVPDRATARLMQRLYRELRRGRRPASALRAAKRARIDTRRPRRTPPFFWAGFRLVGSRP
jgi:CHAT domain-containing protein/tetratricopeptide (TPR) repeat protein